MRLVRRAGWHKKDWCGWWLNGYLLTFDVFGPGRTQYPKIYIMYSAPYTSDYPDCFLNILTINVHLSHSQTEIPIILSVCFVLFRCDCCRCSTQCVRSSTKTHAHTLAILSLIPYIGMYYMWCVYTVYISVIPLLLLIFFWLVGWIELILLYLFGQVIERGCDNVNAFFISTTFVCVANRVHGYR